jgi:hypothetical protein
LKKPSLKPQENPKLNLNPDKNPKIDKNLFDSISKDPCEYLSFDYKDSIRTKDSKPHPYLHPIPKSIKKVREMIKTKGLVDCGENTEENSLVGWTIDRLNDYVDDESRLKLISR